MKVPISQIRPNPFQVRRHVDRERVQALADEIKALGYWGSLRARKKGSQYELCFGHRRLEALKLLKVKDVDLDVLDLSDDDMATQALVENLQREGLNDLEKAAGLKQLINIVDDARGEGQGTKAVSALVGLSTQRIYNLLSLLDMRSASKKLIAQKRISGTVAIEAQGFGGEEMVETAAQHQLPLHTLRNLRAEVEAIPESTIRDRVKKAVIAGKVRDPETVRQRARQARASTSGKAPTDLHIVIRQWTKTMEKWTTQLAEVLPYIDYVEEDATGAVAFKTATRALIDRLKHFL